MDFEGPHFDPSLIGPDGKLTRLHKGGGILGILGGGTPAGPKRTPPPIKPPERGKAATTVATSADRDPSRRVRGAGSTILSSGFQSEQSNKRSILGG